VAQRDRPADESARTLAARRLVPGRAGNPALDRLADLAARLLGSSSAQVSLLADVQHVAAGAGLAEGVVGSTGPLGDSLCTVTLRSGAPLVVDDAMTDERVRALPPVTSGNVGSYLGVPLLTDDGHAVGALCVFDPRPRTWSESDVALLEQLAGPVAAGLSLAALTEDYAAERVLWQLAFDAAGIGAFDWDLRTGELRWDDQLLELFGFDRTTFGGTIEAFNAVVHPDDLVRVTQALESAIETCGEYAAEYRVLLPGGATRWITAQGRALCGDDGRAVRVLGAAFDSTVAQEGEARVQRVLESMPAAFYQLDGEWRFTYVNAEAGRLLGRSRDELVGGNIWELFPAAVGSLFETSYRQAVETGEPVGFDAYYPAPLDNWYEVRAWPSAADGLAVYFNEVTARRQAQQQIERAARRSELLAAVAAQLAQSLDAERAVGRLAPLVVPALADWCLVTLVGEDTHPDWRRRLIDVGGHHADAGMRPVLEEYSACRVRALTDESMVATALRTAEPVVLRRKAGDLAAGVLRSPEARELLRSLDPASFAVVPLLGRDRIVGLLTAARTSARPPFDDEDVETLNQVAGRAGLAVDNVRLYTQQRDLASALQRSLLTPPLRSDELEVEVRYVPATSAAQVGGDWYDSFRQPDGSTVLVIGDVIGHDTAAAAAMGQMRSLLRGIAAHTGNGPADVLHGVDSVMRTLEVDTTATAVVARLERDGSGSTQLRWSNAGHPPPMVLTPDGAVHALGSHDSDLLLGLDPTTSRTEHVAPLQPGATVLLYTDGLVERRGQSLDVGLQLLRDTLVGLVDAEVDLATLCDLTLHQMRPVRPDDDVAIVAVRITA
jgi:PAS domain S-box-containing protein